MISLKYLFFVFNITLFLFIVAHVDNEMFLVRALERLGGKVIDQDEPDIGAAFLKFSVVTKELSALMKTLVRINKQIYTSKGCLLILFFFFLSLAT